MFSHYITRYREGRSWYAESWIQVRLLGRVWCLSRRRVRIGCPPGSVPMVRRDRGDSDGLD